MNIKKIGKFLTIFILYIMKDLIYLVPFAIFNISFSNLNQTSKLILSLFSNLFFVGLLFFIYKDYLIKKFKDFTMNINKYFNISIKYWILGVLVMYISNILIYSFSPVKEAINENTVQTLITASPLLMFLETAFLAPFIEEMLFRKSIQDCFKNKLTFIIISGLVFGLLHVIGGKTIYDYLYIIPYGALGISFACILNKTNNVYFSIMVHFLHNTILTLLAILI